MVFDECWPAASGWSFIDYYGVPKAAYYAFKEAARPVTASFDRQEDGTLQLYAANDTPDAIPAELTLTRIGRDGSAAGALHRLQEIPGRRRFLRFYRPGRAGAWRRRASGMRSALRAGTPQDFL